MLCYVMLLFASRTPTPPQTRLTHAIEVERNTLLSTFGSHCLNFDEFRTHPPLICCQSKLHLHLRPFFFTISRCEGEWGGGGFHQISFTRTVLYSLDIAVARCDFGR